nr:hypothetical protein [Tanacetum cinerariifolium]
MVFWNSMPPRTETDWSLCMRKAKQYMHIVLDAINRLGGTKTDLFSFSPSDPYSLDVLAVTVAASEPVLFGGQTFVASSAPASLRSIWWRPVGRGAYAEAYAMGGLQSSMYLSIRLDIVTLSRLHRYHAVLLHLNLGNCFHLNTNGNCKSRLINGMRGRKNSSDMRVPIMIRASMTLSSSWVTIIRVPLQRPLVTLSRLHRYHAVLLHLNL